MIVYIYTYGNIISLLWYTVDGCEILPQLKTVVYPIIYRVSTSFNHPFGAGFRNHPQLGYPAHFESSGWGLTNAFVKLPSGEINWTNQNLVVLFHQQCLGIYIINGNIRRIHTYHVYIILHIYIYIIYITGIHRDRSWQYGVWLLR